MEFVQQAIRIATHYGSSSVPAIVGVGSGLAYHNANLEELKPPYVLTLISNSQRIPTGEIGSQYTAQRCIESLMLIADWTRDYSDIKSDLLKQYGERGYQAAIHTALTIARLDAGAASERVATLAVYRQLNEKMDALMEIIKQQQAQITAMQISLLVLLPEQEQEEEAKICQ